VLVAYDGSKDNCGWYRGQMRCVADDDGIGGFVIVAFKDPPTGSVEALEGNGNLPATDTATTRQSRRRTARCRRPCSSSSS
jgi:hypothetical protein